MPIVGPRPCPWWVQTALGDTNCRPSSYPMTVANGRADEFSHASAAVPRGGHVMKRVVIDHFGGPEVVSVASLREDADLRQPCGAVFGGDRADG
jgi:hypothetical protein